MFLTALIVIVLLYVAFAGFLYVRQGSMLYYPSGEIIQNPGDLGLAFEEVNLRTKDGVSLSAWYIPSGPERGVILFCHGNAGNISHRLDSIRIFHDLHLGVLIFDYRGYGKSKGSPTEEGTYLDAVSAWEYLVSQRQVAPERIILFGRSLGGSVAAELALRRKAGAIIVESCFTSVPDIGRKLFPFMPVRLLSRFHYSTVDKVGKIKIPKLFVHSPQDEVVPFDHGRSLYVHALPPKQFLEIRGGHNDGFLVSGTAYVNGLDRFISEALLFRE